MSSWIKKGMLVVSMTNLELSMVVGDFVYKTGNAVNENDEIYKKKMLIGVRCYYSGSDGERHYEIYHSKELVPFEIASKGKTEAYRFYSREGKYKDY